MQVTRKDHDNMVSFKKIIVLFPLVYFFIFSSVYAGSTIWCNPANTGPQDGLTKATGYNTLYSAMSAMSSGDEIIIANGDWSSGYGGMTIDNNAGHYPPDGDGPSAMTSIVAETDFGVRIPKLGYIGGSANYLLLRGIIFYNGMSSANGWSYCKFIRCGFFGSKTAGNVATFSLSGYSKYNLVEECIAWGGGRYKFLDYHGENNIFRRCIARHDWYISEWAGQESNFRGYGSQNCVWQNCISIDSDREQYQTINSKEDADFWIGDQSGAGGNLVDGCIVMKGMYQAYYFGGQSGGTNTIEIKNSIAIGPSLIGAQYLTGGMTWGEITVSANNLAMIGYNSGYHHLIGHNKTSGSYTLHSSLFRDGGSVNAGSFDYNYSYNVRPYSYGGNSISADPLINGYRYPVRVEAGSALYSAGKNGGICGPTILKKIGTSGSLKSDVGEWNKVTDEDLWPFPNEDKIKELMRVTVDGVSGQYGFCTGTSKDGSPQTLTKYIWEYLGNTINKEEFKPYAVINIQVVRG